MNKRKSLVIGINGNGATEVWFHSLLVMQVSTGDEQPNLSDLTPIHETETRVFPA
jgi:hypothetical protein